MSGKNWLHALCGTLGVSHSGYDDWHGCAPSRRAQADATLRADIRELLPPPWARMAVPGSSGTLISAGRRSGTTGSPG